MADDINWGGLASGAASGAATGAAAGPYGAAIGAAIGLGISAYGMFSSSSAARASNEAQQRITQLEMQADAVRRQQMEATASRMSLENHRRTAQAASLALTNAVSQGAGGIGMQNSGIAGGLGQVHSQGAWNEQGINWNLQFGEQMFDINKQISMAKLQGANAQMGIQQGQAYSSLGKDIFSSSGSIGRLTSGFGNRSNPTSPGPYEGPTSTSYPYEQGGF